MPPSPIAVACAHLYERLIGMDLLAINGEGELYAPHGVTDTPQYAPGVSSSPEVSNATGMLPLTERQRAMVRVSSHTETGPSRPSGARRTMMKRLS